MAFAVTVAITSSARGGHVMPSAVAKKGSTRVVGVKMRFAKMFLFHPPPRCRCIELRCLLHPSRLRKSAGKLCGTRERGEKNLAF